MNTSSIPTHKRRGLWPLLRFVGRLFLAFRNLVVGLVLIAFVTVVLFGGSKALQPVAVADGSAPTWKVVQAHVSDMWQWDADCRQWWVWSVTLFAPNYAMTPFEMARRGYELTPETIRYFSDHAWSLIAYADPDIERLPPDQGPSKFRCYIPAPQYRTLAELDQIPLPWELP